MHISLHQKILLGFCVLVGINNIQAGRNEVDPIGVIFNHPVYYFSHVAVWAGLIIGVPKLFTYLFNKDNTNVPLSLEELGKEEEAYKIILEQKEKEFNARISFFQDARTKLDEFAKSEPVISQWKFNQHDRLNKEERTVREEYDKTRDCYTGLLNKNQKTRQTIIETERDYKNTFDSVVNTIVEVLKEIPLSKSERLAFQIRLDTAKTLESLRRLESLKATLPKHSRPAPAKDTKDTATEKKPQHNTSTPPVVASNVSPDPKKVPSVPTTPDKKGGFFSSPLPTNVN